MGIDEASGIDLDSGLRSLMEGDFWTRWETAKQLSAWGEPAMAALIDFAQDDTLDSDIRWFAIRALGGADPNTVLEALMSVLQQTEDPDLWAIAAEGLSHLGAASIPALTLLLQDSARRRLAVQTLACIHHPTALTPLCTVVQDADATVRATAIAALGNFRAPVVVPLLQRATEDPVPAVRREAITALGLRGYQSPVESLVQSLLPCLWDPDLAVQQATAIALGRLGTEPAIAALHRALQASQTPEPLQITIVRALGWIQNASALSALLTGLDCGSRPLQLEVVEVCTRFETPLLREQARDALRLYLKDLLPQSTGSEVKRAIALSLGRLQDVQAKPLLQTLLRDPDEQMQVYAQAALRQLVA